VPVTGGGAEMSVTRPIVVESGAESQDFSPGLAVGCAPLRSEACVARAPARVQVESERRDPDLAAVR
jgi:hypothetical protein